MTKIEFEKLFNSNTRTTEDEREKANLDMNSARDIHENYLNTIADFEDIGEAYARLIQRFPGVHSVRWRTKDPIGLIDKIIRKRAEDAVKKSNKYWSISVLNYREAITDLVGIRALYLFKEDFFEIHSSLKSKIGGFIEKPIYYCRDGDLSQDSIARFKSDGFLVKKHPAGYRSIHYTPKGGIDRSKQITFEIQVRSLNDEAWSEVDHKIRYPNFDNNPLIEQLLHILNRLSGSADEMANFIKLLSKNLGEQAEQMAATESEKTKAISKLDNSIKALEKKATDLPPDAQKIINDALKDLRDVEKNPALRLNNDKNSDDWPDFGKLLMSLLLDGNIHTSKPSSPITLYHKKKK